MTAGLNVSKPRAAMVFAKHPVKVDHTKFVELLTSKSG
jgi:hypothetical protein